MGDFQANFHRPEAGIHTVEGNLAGSRAAALEKKRLREQEEYEQRKKQITDDHNRFLNTSIQEKFAGGSVTVTEKVFTEKTVGLVTIEQFKALQAKAARKEEEDDDDDNENTTTKKLSPEEIVAQEKANKKLKKKKLKEKRKMLSTLSFAGDEELAEENDYEVNNKKTNEAIIINNSKGTTTTATTSSICSSSKKDPTVDTSFLPDQQRDIRIKEERIRLEKQWKEEQIRIKQEQLEIVYSYWDGAGHRRVVTVRKGNTIGEFLEVVQQDLSKEFRELSKLGADGLLYIKEDLIIPYDITFYDLIVTKARGKSGPLFHFDVHDDIRTGTIDVRIEKDESHPGKVVDRRWYERNKHIFPASRWEYYDPLKDYGTYKIGGK